MADMPQSDGIEIEESPVPQKQLAPMPAGSNYYFESSFPNPVPQRPQCTCCEHKRRPPAPIPLPPPGTPAAFLHQGCVYRDQGDLDSAISQWQQALELDPQYWEAHCHLGYALRERGDLKDAIHSLRRALKSQRHDPDLLCNLGTTLGQIGNLTEAILTLEQAVEVDPLHAAAYHNLGFALSQKGDLQGAISKCRR